MSTILKTGPAPHIRTAETVESVMYDVVIALIPAFAMAVYSFGVRALILTAVSVATCIATEYIWQKILKRDIEAFDGSAILTGILFAFVVPVGMGLQYVIVGNFVAITLGKIVYGGLGHNIFNPALIGRAFVQASWPVAITTFAYDGKAGATVLDAMKRGIPLTDSLIYEGGNQYINAFLGQMGGCLGETSALALLIGGVYLIYKKQIDWKVPAVMIGTVFVLTWAMGANPFMQILSGGLFLGAFFMATDMVTSPITGKGRVIFALGIGILVSLIRIKGGYPEGTAYAILIMNGVVPLIDRYIRAKKFGGVSKNGK
ncbi:MULTISPECIES: RnfABCDGE type electron transport complex subunit D [Fusobacterium]|uniref:Ion-translocating oxidoreductase complex subunit D n=8 Tax=Fusobacterium TaxID=848 RepID=F9EL31_9FUSO|nr:MULTISPECIES: RnfABCDGE type electron transport complex subunit D [Fusobacterium]EFD81686.1 Na(+)-translocating NADH-quinone reductase subunit B [Fusobacterium animalis D11]EGQ80326.1 NADH dehydrogenase (ubiquinone), RnfB subunit [Fusobacterium animalis ATCC 51191]MCL4576615.1 electron transporter RnfD [Fusobacterium nucleatum YWH7056]MCL4582036.1 electron transporter RnfD [Fusobacterium nucleatum YWH7199]MCL4583987.1 electron transporter RnfD [Fusobacterium nucleatum YWH7054]MCL4584499.1 